jgi:hypothetical protein
METPCLAKDGKSKRRNVCRMENQTFKRDSTKMVRKAHNRTGICRGNRKYMILVTYPEPYKERPKAQREGGSQESP